MWGHRVDWLPRECGGSGTFGESMVMDLHITHERWGSSSDPSINGHLHYPNDIDGSLNEVVTDKIRTYHTDYDNNPPNTISFIPAIASTSGRLRGEFGCLLFLQGHRESDRFFPVSGVQLAQHDRDQFHFRHSVFTSPDHTLTHHTRKPLGY